MDTLSETKTRDSSPKSEDEHPPRPLGAKFDIGRSWDSQSAVTRRVESFGQSQNFYGTAKN